MLDPLTTFGLSINILNIILGTIPALETKYNEIFELGPILARFNRTLDQCSAIFMLWNAIWVREEMNEESYQSLFGPRGWAEIKVPKQHVEKLLTKVHSSLCLTDPSDKPAKEGDAASQATSFLSRLTSRTLKRGLFRNLLKGKWRKPILVDNKGVLVLNSMADIPKDLSPEEYLEWVSFTRSLSDPQSRPKPNNSIFQRVTGLLGRNQRLGRNIDLLKEEVSRLNDLAKTHSELRGNKDAKVFANNLNFSLFARTFSHQILRWDNKLPNSGWYLQYSRCI